MAPLARIRSESTSDRSTEVVPMSTGRPREFICNISVHTARYLASSVRKITSLKSLRRQNTGVFGSDVREKKKNLLFSSL